MVEFTYFVYIVVYSVGQTFGDAGTNITFLATLVADIGRRILLGATVGWCCRLSLLARKGDQLLQHRIAVWLGTISCRGYW